MTVEIALFICVLAAYACYLVWKWQAAVENMANEIAPPPYQEPVVDKLEPTALNPQAAWPFPSGSKP